MTIGDKIKEFGLKKFGSIKNLSEHLGMKPPAIYSYIRGEREPGTPILQKLQKLGCNINWLLSNESYDYLYSNTDQNVINQLEYRVDGVIPAGKSELVDLTDWIQTEVLDFSPESHALLVVDDQFGYSMTPVLQPGDYVMYSYNAKISNNDLVAAKWDSTKGAVKICNFIADNPNFVALVSSNPSVSPIILNKTKVVMYKIVMIIKKRKP